MLSLLFHLESICSLNRVFGVEGFDLFLWPDLISMKKPIVQHLLALGIFIVLAFAFNYPASQGQHLRAGDTVHWMGMSEEARAWYEKTGENPMWSNSMFGGMPTVTHYMRGKTNLIYPIQEFLTDHLPLPIPFFLIAMICFYILMSSWNIRSWLAIAGAVAYAFAAYNVQIIAAGHNTKMFSIGYMPLVMAGMQWVYHQKYLIGAGAALLGLSLMISNAMYQIDYYLLIILGLLAIGYLLQALKENGLKPFLISSGIMLAVGLVSVGPSLDQLMLTQEYTKQTMRGGQSEVTIGKDKNKTNGGLDKDYAFQWSQSIGETFTLLVPNLYGGANQTDVGTSSKTYEAVSSLAGEQTAEQFARNASTYWGPQPFLSGPVYFGAIIIFLMVLGLFVIDHRIKWFLFGIGVLGIMLSWGRHFSALNYFLFDHLPMYNKFRTPSMAMVIPGLTFCLLALWGLKEYLSGKLQDAKLFNGLKNSFIITAGLCLLFGLGSRFFLSFKGENDDKLKAQIVQMTGNEQAGSTIFNAIVEDRPGLAMKDGIRSFLLIAFAAGLLWMFWRKKLDAQKVSIGILLLISFDLLSIGTRYLNEENYSSEEEFQAQFNPRPVDQQIKQDTDPYYRVLDLTTDPYNDAMGAYHHKLVGGYHPAKMEIYQDLISTHLLGGKLNAEVLNMLNTKYLIFSAGKEPTAQRNQQACGNAWFVPGIKTVKDANEAITALSAENLGDTVKVANPFRPKEIAIVKQADWKQNTTQFVVDSTARINLTYYGLNNLTFKSANANPGFAVFSDIYYPLGWKAFVDGKETPIVQTNYVLRGLPIPAGQHTIEFKFHPDTYFKWNTASMISSVLILLILVGGIGLGVRDEIKKQTA